MPVTTRLVCLSDTHNDDPTPRVPDGDILLHAGDLTDEGTPEELKEALAWLRKLPHKTKIVIAGNHDRALDSNHAAYDESIHALFTSPEVLADGIIYLDASKPTLTSPISIYANPTQPDFLNSTYAFTYAPYPSPASVSHWSSAPPSAAAPEQKDVWITHGAPKGRLDKINVPGLMGCEAQWEKVRVAKPLLCVFGHYHMSYGVEKVVWGEEGDEVVESQMLTKGGGVYDFTGLKKGKESVFVNVAWMTGEKRQVEKRNDPVVIDLSL